MKKKLIMFLLVAVVSITSVFTGCFSDNTFGEFGYNGVYLQAFAVKEISAEEAKTVLSNYGTGLSLAANSAINNPELAAKSIDSKAVSGLTDDDIYSIVDENEVAAKVQSILNSYSGCEITTYYYVENESDKQSKTDILQGTDFKNMLESNEFTSFSQLIAKYLIAYPTLIDYMEEKNKQFKESGQSNIAPFNNIFTYHNDADGNLVIQTSDYAEIAASVGGGIGCNFRQDAEILYDSEFKISKWHTSLGIWSATPQGTMKQGYILEVEFNWIPKN